MNSHGFEEIDHTADLALRVWGEDFYDLLEAAAKGLYHLLNLKAIKDTSHEYFFSIEMDSKEVVLVDFLNELLYLCEEQEMMFSDFSISQDGGSVNILAKGKRIASLGRNIKAVTFHELEIKEQQTKMITTITFDV